MPLVVDLTRTRFCDSAGMHALVDAYKRARAEGGQVLLAVSGAAVPRILEITGIDRVTPPLRQRGRGARVHSGREPSRPPQASRAAPG